MIPATLNVAAALTAAAARGGVDQLSGPATVAAVALAALFTVTSVAKLASPGATIDQFRRLRLPAPTFLAGAVPGAELLAAAALVLTPRVGGLLALALLGAFTVVIVRTVRSGLVVSCGCLGSIGRRPVSWDAVVRNAALGCLAGLSTTTGSLQRPDLPSLLIVAGFGLLALVVVQLAALRHSLGRIWSVGLAGEMGRGGPGRNPS